MKKLNCCDAGFDCPAVVRADSEEEVLAIAAQHALEAHGEAVRMRVHGAAFGGDRALAVFQAAFPVGGCFFINLHVFDRKSVNADLLTIVPIE